MLDAVGLSQIFFPTQNLERAYQVDKESEAVLWCAGPQKVPKSKFSKMLTVISGQKKIRKNSKK